MADKVKEINNDVHDVGTVKISEEVLAAIASLATKEVDGVAEIIGAKQNSFLGGKKSLGKGIKITLDNEEAVIEMSISVRYGEVLVDVAKKIQESVKKSVENMTDIPVREVNVNIAGIDFPSKKELTQIEEAE
ncbi:Asp23/Gls24 family envelope stress response protein [Clostridia bacterium]|nr:Asp23/Gls24 family envelope stress response protein [Clostridia bacterium]